jgi:hypothetical protein
MVCWGLEATPERTPLYAASIEGLVTRYGAVVAQSQQRPPRPAPCSTAARSGPGPADKVTVAARVAAASHVSPFTVLALTKVAPWKEDSFIMVQGRREPPSSRCTFIFVFPCGPCHPLPTLVTWNSTSNPLILTPMSTTSVRPWSLSFTALIYTIPTIPNIRVENPTSK